MQNAITPWLKPSTPEDALDQYSLGQKQALINALKQSAMQSQQPQQMGAIASRTSPLSPMLQALTGYLAGKEQKNLNNDYASLAKQQGEKAVELMKPIIAPPVGDAQIDPNAMGPPAALQNSSQPSPMNPGGLDPKVAAQLYQSLGAKDYSSQYIQPYNDPKAKQDQANKDRDYALRVAAANKLKISPTADGLAWNGTNFLDPDGKVLDAEGVKKWKIGLAGERAQAVQDTKPPKGGFTLEHGALLASMAERGLSLPTGLRSKEQQIATLDGLMARNQGKSPDQIADMIASGQISFGVDKKQTQIAAAQAGKIAYAENEIKQLAPLVREASLAIPRGKFVSYNKLKQYTDAQLSDPKLKELKAYLTTLSNAYDMLAARGGTDMEKRKHTREMFESADSHEALEAVLKAVLKEAEVSGNAAAAAVKPISQHGKGVPEDIQALLDKYK